MNLTLEVVSPNARDLGASKRKVFGVEGGRIGRAPECEWVLPNPYVSRHHATVRWISGKFYIESASDSGVAIGSANSVLPKLERRPLNAGDRIFLDEYEIAVGIVGATSEGLQPAFGAGEAAGLIPSEDDPFAPAPVAHSRAAAIPADPFEPIPEDLDPLKQLTGNATHASPTAPRHETGWNHTPGLADQFTPPPVPSASAGGIPDDWDNTSFGRGAPQPAAPAGGIPDDWDKTSFGRGKSPSVAQPPVYAAAPSPSRAHAPRPMTAPPPRFMPPSPAMAPPMQSLNR